LTTKATALEWGGLNKKANVQKASQPEKEKFWYALKAFIWEEL
jgi:hypothetical protein